jgi:DNA-binding MarR family transcriptional regulator
VEALPRNHAILIDRLDYLISRNGFRGALELVHRLREVAYLMGHIIIISLDPATLDGRRLRALEKETSEMAPRGPLSLPLEQLDIIRYVLEQSITGVRPTLTEVGEALNLSKPTARKHARDAACEGYIVLSRRGRTKVLELTEKGRSVFSK